MNSCLTSYPAKPVLLGQTETWCSLIFTSAAIMYLWFNGGKRLVELEFQNGKNRSFIKEAESDEGRATDHTWYVHCCIFNVYCQWSTDRSHKATRRESKQINLLKIICLFFSEIEARLRRRPRQRRHQSPLHESVAHTYIHDDHRPTQWCQVSNISDSSRWIIQVKEL